MTDLSSSFGGPGAILQKLRQYCAYQERSHAEVVSKMYELRVKKSDQDEMLATLVQEDYLNEERFAKAFVGGKFRMKDWGRKKIYYELKQKGVSEYNIKKGMEEIDEEAYYETLKELTEKKYASLKSEQHFVRKKKTLDYMMQKGFEPNLVSEILQELSKTK